MTVIIISPAVIIPAETSRSKACNQSADDDDSHEGILDEGGQLTPIDDLASPEDSYFLEFECTGGQAEKMVLSPPSLPSSNELYPDQ